MKKRTLLLAATAVLAVPAIAFAFGGPGKAPWGKSGYGPGYNAPAFGGGMMRGRMIFKQADANKDGVVTRDEAIALRDSKFAGFDTDKNGTVDMTEIDKALTVKLEQMRIRMRYRLLGRFDANGDGVIAKDEFDAKGLKRFDLADINADGKVTMAEVNQLGAKFGRFMRRGRGHGMRGGHRMMRGYGGPGMMRGPGGPGMMGGPGMK